MPREQLPNDLGRVDGLFQKALDSGINIQMGEVKYSKKSISGEEISVLILSGKYIAVALVDKYKLSVGGLSVCVLRFYSMFGLIFSGHYIVICGFDADADEFEIRDPASSREHERVSLECLEEARKSFGTDEDILLIHKTENEESIKNVYQDTEMTIFSNFAWIIHEKREIDEEMCTVKEDLHGMNILAMGMLELSAKGKKDASQSENREDTDAWPSRPWSKWYERIQGRHGFAEIGFCKQALSLIYLKVFGWIDCAGLIGEERRGKQALERLLKF
ncbi:hypothetical protein ACLOJK_012570 [Asimina triloba]